MWLGLRPRLRREAISISLRVRVRVRVRIRVRGFRLGSGWTLPRRRLRYQKDLVSLTSGARVGARARFRIAPFLPSPQRCPSRGPRLSPLASPPSAPPRSHTPHPQSTHTRDLAPPRCPSPRGAPALRVSLYQDFYFLRLRFLFLFFFYFPSHALDFSHVFQLSAN